MVVLLSVPSNFLSSSSNTYPSQSFFFLKFNPRTRSLNSRKIINCCQQTVQLDNETLHTITLVKKKRKPRPSFVEQIQNKWSLKTPSLRENFPWQEEQEEFRAQTTPFSQNVSSAKEIEVSVSVSERVVVTHVKKPKSILAPWVHGNESRRELPVSEGSTKNQENVRTEKEFLVSPVRVLAEYGKSDEKFIEFDETPIRLTEKNAVVENSATTDRTATRIKPSVNGDGLNRLPWERKNDEEFVKKDKLRKTSTSLAEGLVPEHELKRLRNVSLRMVERIKVGAAGVTQALVDSIHDKWKNEEVVKLKFLGPPSKNMKRTHEILERRTGGLVIWRSGSSLVLYRGMTYNLDCVKSYTKHVEDDAEELESSKEDSPQRIKVKKRPGESSGTFDSDYFNNLSEEEQMDLSEMNLLLDELGPRFIDWSGRDPLPVDADLLPPVVPGYKTPYRLLPHGIRQPLRDKQMTYIRRTARTMPPHFVLGRNRELQGLALAMVKLWEKSSLAKIAIKRGVLNTSNERMAEELKRLTGGTLVSRNKEFIVFYRGNDFLPPGISSALTEKENSITLQQDHEEKARQRAASLIEPKLKALSKKHKPLLVAGTLAETIAATTRWGNQSNGADMEKMMRENAVDRHAFLVNSLQKKLALAKEKMRKAEKSLQKVLENQEPGDLPTDLETLTDEERFLFRRIGLSMKPYLLLGRREIFDGTIENMHLHWKYRELVKIMVQRKTFPQVKHIAVSLEAESGGVLVSVDKTFKGYVIIVYRGKNYQSPLAFRPRNLLTKRQALARSIELQRREALKHHVWELEEKFEKLKQELEDMMAANKNGAESSGSRINSAS
ncbi:hypothetical protein ABFS82_10G090500 [Erythranthe guttata]|uniref:CRM domain-containing protein n=1 Tax=Erythranthe guttata TaxID=4155 RepID=A0A022QPL0_ERYGU|nr:PREDICTED: chloroplastic group IIA intron splicing facilitator CRS1, chloroplastic [Erythranthe guttata]EYU29891.1 hypothetical protein MIMGU_mgv1a001353mg [Erythranthe guttata]|eukprot:XP_012846341.1 PREDICTED: chloroplastic group IIA intron splicing facilitator CRS1, chloroplastic [Erythranthe guttata]